MFKRFMDRGGNLITGLITGFAIGHGMRICFRGDSSGFIWLFVGAVCMWLTIVYFWREYKRLYR